MVVCSSRPHAVRMWKALGKYINNNGYDLGVLVAFSGEVDDLTESKANGFPESETATRFRQRRVPGHGGGGEVPDRFRPAQAGGHVR